MTLHVPAGVLDVLAGMVLEEGRSLDLILVTALVEFACLEATDRRGLIGEFLALATGPRSPVLLPDTALGDYTKWCGKTAGNAALTALWVFSRLPEEDRLGLIGLAALRG